MSYNISSDNLNNPLLKNLLKELSDFFGGINVEVADLLVAKKDLKK